MTGMFDSKNLNKPGVIAAEVAVVLLWGFQLLSSEAYSVCYVLLLMLTFACIVDNCKNGETLFSNGRQRHDEVIISVFSILFACMVAFANHELWALAVLPDDFGYGFRLCYHYSMMILMLAGGFLAFKNIFIAFARYKERFVLRKAENTVDPRVAFAVSFGLLVVTRLIVLFSCQYPGELTPDSISQMNQLLSGNYSNHHPFYHTMVIKLFVMLGMHFFNDINAAVATYSVFQIIFTALSFAYAIKTMAMMKLSRTIVIVSTLFFVLMPYHIMYAMTMWKDIMFGCFVLLLITAFFRCLSNVGNRILNYIILMVSGIGTCLFRSNGFFAFVLLTLAFVAIWKKDNRRILVMFVAAIVVSFLMKHAVLAGLDVAQPDVIESLSVPVQQIARVVEEGCELEHWQRELLSNVIDIDKISENYTPGISDPIKKMVRQKGNQHLLIEQRGEYVKLYLSLGRAYPMVFLRAWIDQTRGYWNAGYEYWRWYTKVFENDLGIERTTNSTAIDLMLSEYLWLFTNIQGLRLFLSIGLFVWIDMLMLMKALLGKDKAGVFVSLPVLVIVASLLIATPVFSEFRYIYAAFCTLPMVMAITLRPLETQ